MIKREATVVEVRRAAMDLLARREHGSAELRSKLIVKGYPEPLIDPVLSTLATEGLQNDERFVEVFVRSRRERGFGPLKIAAELRQRGVSDECIDPALDSRDRDWRVAATAARDKRFGAAPLADFKERARQARFLHGRGYTSEQIRAALGGERDE